MKIADKKKIKEYLNSAMPSILHFRISSLSICKNVNIKLHKNVILPAALYG
jgi:hypothetical protein